MDKKTGVGKFVMIRKLTIQLIQCIWCVQCYNKIRNNEIFLDCLIDLYFIACNFEIQNIHCFIYHQNHHHELNGKSIYYNYTNVLCL